MAVSLGALGTYLAGGAAAGGAAAGAGAGAAAAGTAAAATAGTAVAAGAGAAAADAALAEVTVTAAAAGGGVGAGTAAAVGGAAAAGGVAAAAAPAAHSTLMTTLNEASAVATGASALNMLAQGGRGPNIPPIPNSIGNDQDVQASEQAARSRQEAAGGLNSTTGTAGGMTGAVLNPSTVSSKSLLGG